MNEPKYRHELKYLVSNGQIEILKSRLALLCPKDPHANENGIYNISSLYFDDYYNKCLNENIAGTDPREKFRIRIYNHDSSRITLECKRKERGKTLKTSCPLSIAQFNSIVKGDLIYDDKQNPPVLAKFLNEMRLHKMHPVIIVEYDRVPYIYKSGNVRITLDTNLCSSNILDLFLQGGYSKRPVMPTGMSLLEVKYDEFLPDYIYRALQLDNLQQTAYSKYYLCRRYSL